MQSGVAIQASAVPSAAGMATPDQGSGGAGDARLPPPDPPSRVAPPAVPGGAWSTQVGVKTSRSAKERLSSSGRSLDFGGSEAEGEAVVSADPFFETDAFLALQVQLSRLRRRYKRSSQEHRRLEREAKVKAKMSAAEGQGTAKRGASEADGEAEAGGGVPGEAAAAGGEADPASPKRRRAREGGRAVEPEASAPEGRVKVYVCDVCARQFTHPPAFSQHKRSHRPA